MARIFWDTNLFIYLVGDSGPLGARVAQMAERMLDRKDQLFTSTQTLGELLVHPTRAENPALCRRYEEVLARHANLITFDEEAARLYAQIRKNRAIKAPDAIQLACAAKAQADLFITNDAPLSKTIVPGIKFLSTLENSPV